MLYICYISIPCFTRSLSQLGAVEECKLNVERGRIPTAQAGARIGVKDEIEVFELPQPPPPCRSPAVV
jgi:hypothetical protein